MVWIFIKDNKTHKIPIEILKFSFCWISLISMMDNESKGPVYATAELEEERDDL